MLRSIVGWIFWSVLGTFLNFLAISCFDVGTVSASLDNIIPSYGFLEKASKLPLAKFAAFLSRVIHVAKMIAQYLFHTIVPSQESERKDRAIQIVLQWCSGPILSVCISITTIITALTCWCAHASILHRNKHVRGLALVLYYVLYYSMRMLYIFLSETVIMGSITGIVASDIQEGSGWRSSVACTFKFIFLAAGILLSVISSTMVIAQFSYHSIIKNSFYSFKWLFRDCVLGCLPEHTHIAIKIISYPFLAIFCACASWVFCLIQLWCISLGLPNPPKAGRIIFAVLIVLIFCGGGTVSLIIGCIYKDALMIGLSVAGVVTGFSGVLVLRAHSMTDTRTFDFQASIDSLPESDAVQFVVRSEARARASFFALVPFMGTTIVSCSQHLALNPLRWRGVYRPIHYTAGWGCMLSFLAMIFTGSYIALIVYVALYLFLRLSYTREASDDSIRNTPRPWMGWKLPQILKWEAEMVEQVHSGDENAARSRKQIEFVDTVMVGPLVGRMSSASASQIPLDDSTSRAPSTEPQNTPDPNSVAVSVEPSDQGESAINEGLMTPRFTDAPDAVSQWGKQITPTVSSRPQFDIFRAFRIRN